MLRLAALVPVFKSIHPPPSLNLVKFFIENFVKIEKKNVQNEKK